MTIPSSQLSLWIARENKMSKHCRRTGRVLANYSSSNKALHGDSQRTFLSPNPSGFLLLWLHAVNTAPVSEQETVTDAAAHRIPFAVHDLPSAPLYCVYKNLLLHFFKL